MNSNLQNKLSNFEASPSGGVWDKIAGALDNENDFAQRLYHYQQNPKTDIWTKVEASLEEAAPAKVVPFTTRYRKPIRYIAVAGILAVILVSATLLMKRTEAGSLDTTAQQKTLPAKDAAIQKSPITPTPNADSQLSTVATLQDNTPNGRYKVSNSQKRILAFIKPQNIFSAVVLSGRFAPKQAYKKEMFNHASLNDYMIYSDDDGTAMKLPKKLFSLVSCPAGDGSCKERIQQLQQKLSSNAMSADFTGILEMLRQLK